MNPIVIGRRRLSHIIWQIIDERVGHLNVNFSKIIEDHHAKKDQADVKTGSIGFDDAVDLYKIVNCFKPRVIAEVGTYVGTSTMTMLVAVPESTIYTCDCSNSIDLDNEQIHQYKKKHSYEMFADLAEKNIKVDLIYLDGRLGKDDVEPLSKIIHDKTIFVMDDFEGVEKGVANSMMLESKSRALVYPREKRKTAISIPFVTMLQFSSQEAV